jgi:SNF2 family DNA or RNA helicase
MLRGGGARGQGAEALQLIMQLRQLCAHPGMAQSGSLKWREPGWLARSGKLAVLDALLHEVRRADASDRVVLVSCFTATLDLLDKLCQLRGYSFARLDGATPVDQRIALVNRFNGPDGPFVFLLSSRAGCVVPAP